MRPLPPCIVAGLLALGVFAYGAAPPAGAAGDDAPISIAVVPFGLLAGTPAPPVDVAERIRAQLASSPRLAPIATASLPARPTRMTEIRFEDWRRANVDYLVVGVVGMVHDGGHEVEFRLVDTRSEASLVGYLVPSGIGELEQTARRIAQMIGERLAGRTGAPPDPDGRGPAPSTRPPAASGSS